MTVPSQWVDANVSGNPTLMQAMKNHAEAAAGVRVDAPTKCKDCGAKITDGAAKCPRGGGRTCWVGQQPTSGVLVGPRRKLPQVEFDALLDHIYENGTTAEGVYELALALCEAYARGVKTVAAPQPWDNAAAYEAWLLRHWPNNAQARAIYHNEMNTRAAFVAGAEWERTRGVPGDGDYYSEEAADIAESKARNAGVTVPSTSSDESNK